MQRSSPGLANTWAFGVQAPDCLCLWTLTPAFPALRGLGGTQGRGATPTCLASLPQGGPRGVLSRWSWGEGGVNSAQSQNFSQGRSQLKDLVERVDNCPLDEGGGGEVPCQRGSYSRVMRMSLCAGLGECHNGCRRGLAPAQDAECQAPAFALDLQAEWVVVTLPAVLGLSAGRRTLGLRGRRREGPGCCPPPPVSLRGSRDPETSSCKVPLALNGSALETFLLWHPVVLRDPIWGGAASSGEGWGRLPQLSRG